MSYSIGIDIGSTCSKVAVMDGEKNILLLELQPTGWSSVDTAEKIAKELAEKGYPVEGAAGCIATGYGRISVPFATKKVTEIACHAKGAAYLFNCPELTVIDIGGQDTKGITVSGGVAADFIMNDKCAAGTGRFMEVMANTLGVKLDALPVMASEGSGTKISSMCTVFAESEVISLIGKGESRENIAYAVVRSIVEKVGAQVKRLSTLDGKFVLTGGLCDFEYVVEALSDVLGKPVETCPNARYAGAIGAAISGLAK